MRKEILLERIDLLKISLEAIFINQKLKNDIITINYLNNDLRNKSYSKIQRFSLIIAYIHNITKIIRENHITIVAKRIIENDKKIDRYLIKFSYIYFRNKKFYSNYKSLTIGQFQSASINRFAILTIYIISELSNNKGIYKLAKFLSE
uniref:Uncharacterized protein n=1 Tax=Polysiphonia sertularioides TaxID=945028 RepID=A0A1Z1M9K0_9FLOR|nr:hypothetical protein [Polysiphonia sertularioides]ARW62583.1 hypothetical protein [Polysiphonia sertularioides]